MSGHTLAPWHLVPIANSPAPEQHFSVQSVDIDAGDYVADVWCEADARLIAAAPDLLAALKAWIGHRAAVTRAALQREPHDPSWAQKIDRIVADAEAAIAKAEGK